MELSNYSWVEMVRKAEKNITIGGIERLSERERGNKVGEREGFVFVFVFFLAYSEPVSAPGTFTYFLSLKRGTGMV